MIIYCNNQPTSKTFLKNGKDFLRAAELCLGSKTETGNYRILEAIPAPCCVNASFACEMFFKAVYVEKKIEYSHKHKLNELYSALPDDYKNLLAHCAFNTEQALERFLTKFNDCFVETRYYVENAGDAHFDILGIYSLAFNIYASTEYYLKNCNEEAQGNGEAG